MRLGARFRSRWPITGHLRAHLGRVAGENMADAPKNANKGGV